MQTVRRIESRRGGAISVRVLPAHHGCGVMAGVAAEKSARCSGGERSGRRRKHTVVRISTATAAAATSADESGVMNRRRCGCGVMMVLGGHVRGEAGDGERV